MRPIVVHSPSARALLVLMPILAVLMSSGCCTVTGRMLGSGIDRRVAHGETPDSALVRSAQGREIVIRTRDHRRHVGRVARIVTAPDTVFVFSAPLPRNDIFAASDRESVRIALRDVETIALPGSTAEGLIGSVGFAADAWLAFQLATVLFVGHAWRGLE